MTNYSELKRVHKNLLMTEDEQLSSDRDMRAFRSMEAECDRLKSDNKRLTAELECARGDMRQADQIMERDRKDAERYRWLRKTADPATWEYISHQNPVVIDIEIDAAMTKDEKP